MTDVIVKKCDLWQKWGSSLFPIFDQAQRLQRLNPEDAALSEFCDNLELTLKLMHKATNTSGHLTAFNPELTPITNQEKGLCIRINIRRIRRSQNLSQAAFAKKAKVPQKALARWEKDATPSLGDLNRLAEALGVSVDTLLAYPHEAEKR